MIPGIFQGTQDDFSQFDATSWVTQIIQDMVIRTIRISICRYNNGKMKV